MSSLTMPSPLVGRDRELDMLRQHLNAAFAGQGSLVLIGGEAGIGKTALAETICREAEEQGALVLVGRCYDLTETPPYGPWVELFATYLQKSDGPVLPTAFAQQGTVGAVDSQPALFRAVQKFFAALATRQPLVLLLDDLHWTDPVSLDLLRFLARTVASLPMLILVTYRVDELTRRHPLYQLLPLLERESVAIRMDLRRLSPDAVRALVGAWYPFVDTDADRLVGYLYARAGGNAFFTVQLLRALAEGNVLCVTDDGWIVGDLGRIHVPMALRQVIDGRLARLSEEAQRLLGVAAVIGQEAQLTLWAMVTETDEDALLNVVEQAVRARIVEEMEDGMRVRFVHALIREAVYEGMSAVHRRRWHARLGDALIAIPFSDPDAVANHLRRAGDARAATWLIKAGERAGRAYAWKTAADRFEDVLKLMDDGADPGERSWLLYHLAAYRRWTDPTACIAYLTDAERCAAVAGDRGLAASAVFTRGVARCITGNFIQGLDDMKRGVDARRALTVTERASLSERALAEDTGDKTDGQGKLVQWLATAGRFQEARFVGERALAELDAPLRAETAHDLALTDTYYGLAQAYAGLGFMAEALHAYRCTRQVYRASGQMPMVGITAQNEFRWTASYRMDRPAELLHLLAEVDDAYAHAADSVSDWQRRYPNALRLLLGGKWMEARQLFLTGHKHRQEALVRQWVSPVARAQGDTALAWELVHAALPDGPATEPGSRGFHTAITVLAVAVGLALDAGNLDSAKTWLETHDRWVRWSDGPLGRADGVLLRAMYDRASGAGMEASRHADQALKEANSPRQPLVLLEARCLLGELETDAGHIDAARTHLAAALVLADACALPFERARTLLAWARLHTATGNHADALALLDEVRALCLPLGAAPTLAAVDTLMERIAHTKVSPTLQPAGLSTREVEVLRLLTSGKTNREIADTLFIAPATVSIHVTHILTKTGTANRAEATAFALRHGIA